MSEANVAEAFFRIIYESDSKGLSAGVKDAVAVLSHKLGQEVKGGLSRAINETLSIAFIVESAKKLVELGSHVTEMSKKFHSSAEDLQILERASKATGLSTEGMSMALKRLSVVMQLAQSGNSGARNTLAAFGIGADNDRDPVNTMLQMARNVYEVKDAYAGSAEALKAFGRSGDQVLAAMEDGLAKEADEINRNTVLTTEAAKQLKVAGDEIKKIWAEVTGGIASAFAQLTIGIGQPAGKLNQMAGRNENVFGAGGTGMAGAGGATGGWASFISSYAPGNAEEDQEAARQAARLAQLQQTDQLAKLKVQLEIQQSIFKLQLQMLTPKQRMIALQTEELRLQEQIEAETDRDKKADLLRQYVATAGERFGLQLQQDTLSPVKPAADALSRIGLYRGAEPQMQLIGKEQLRETKKSNDILERALDVLKEGLTDSGG